MYCVGLYGEYQLLCEILIKLELCLQVLEKHSDIKFYKNLSSAAKLFYSDGRTEGHDEANRRFSQLCNST